MSEYIITDEQIAENRRLHGKKLLVMPKIVRCRDCKFCDNDVFAYWCCRNKYREFEVDLLDGERMGFCAWGERKERIES